MKTAELKGLELDYWVAKAEGLNPERFSTDGRMWIRITGAGTPYRPSEWAGQGQPIMERERIGAIWVAMSETWVSVVPGREVSQHVTVEAETMLVAAMRAYVTSKFGDEVPDA